MSHSLSFVIFLSEINKAKQEINITKDARDRVHYISRLYLTYFVARPVSVQAGPPSASGCPLRVHPELDEASHRHRVGP